MRRAIVESRYDSLGIGRVRIRIPTLHGVDIKSEYLPFATPIFQGGGNDSGPFYVPEVGSIVMVDKEDGTDSWFYIGVVRGTGRSTERGKFISSEDAIGGSYKSTGGIEVPCESATTGDPTTSTVFKSIKGSTIYITDADGQERLDIVSHCGASISLVSPRTDGKHEKGLEMKRPTGTNMNFPDDDSKYGTTGIIIKDQAGNIIRSLSKKEDKTGKMNNVIEMVSNKGELNSKEDRVFSGVVLNPSEGKATLFVQEDPKLLPTGQPDTTKKPIRSEVIVTKDTVKLQTGLSALIINKDSIDFNTQTLNFGAKNFTISASETMSVLGKNVVVEGSETVIMNSKDTKVTGGTTLIDGKTSIKIVSPKLDLSSENTLYSAKSGMKIFSGGKLDVLGATTNIAGTTQANLLAPTCGVGGGAVTVGPGIGIGVPPAATPPVIQPSSDSTTTVDPVFDPNDVQTDIDTKIVLGNWDNYVVSPQFGGELVPHIHGYEPDGS